MKKHILAIFAIKNLLGGVWRVLSTTFGHGESDSDVKIIQKHQLIGENRKTKKLKKNRLIFYINPFKQYALRAPKHPPNTFNISSQTSCKPCL